MQTTHAQRHAHAHNTGHNAASKHTLHDHTLTKKHKAHRTPGKTERINTEHQAHVTFYAVMNVLVRGHVQWRLTVSLLSALRPYGQQHFDDTIVPAFPEAETSVNNPLSHTSPRSRSYAA